MNYLAQLLAGNADQHWPATVPGGTRVTMLGEGLIAIEPLTPVFDLFISSGIHGNETAPIELAAKLLQAILDGALIPRARVLFAFGNPEAIRRNERYLDDDLNRLFGKPAAQTGEGPAACRARELEAVAKAFFAQSGTRWKLHYDLHTAIRGSKIEKFAIYPFPHEQAFDTDEIARLAACGIEAVLLQPKPSPTFSYFTRQYCGAQGFTLELGKAQPFGQNEGVNLDLLEAELRRLLSGERLDYSSQAQPALYQVAREVIKQTDAFVLNLDDAVENFTELAEGYVLAEDGDNRFIVEEPGARIVFPNRKVKNGLRAGLLVVPTAL
ncbi:succinylglutamate desuccinylase [Chitinimonas sp. BJB300]|uniref:succinylglutamate desuccinylase n=1 Tax=Chitinimonas sp. BJB300 TaxID=1559339 RepID=UPI000C0EC61C|nr:succinylglutamate desuccinylase [Chitinimonas sp. BJB300]PHV11751.1 succinylglutamate desuccinylase [Chitinimonas sp. BJB300]TSJ87111.1 succinylglutamate desuccinylase [Chitinimonas sp. BJB300]